MTNLLVLATIAVLLYLFRAGGFLFSRVTLPSMAERSLRFVPVAAIASLIVSGLAARKEEVGTRTVALAVAALVTARYPMAWLCIASGMLVYGLLRWLL